MLLNIVLSPDEYFLLGTVFISHTGYRSWPGLKGPVCAFTLVFQKFSHKNFLKIILQSTT